jgi:hypothetical protein
VLEQTNNEMHPLEIAKQSAESQTGDTAHGRIIRLRNSIKWTTTNNSSAPEKIVKSTQQSDLAFSRYRKVGEGIQGQSFLPPDSAAQLAPLNIV